MAYLVCCRLWVQSPTLLKNKINNNNNKITSKHKSYGITLVFKDFPFQNKIQSPCHLLKAWWASSSVTCLTWTLPRYLAALLWLSLESFQYTQAAAHGFQVLLFGTLFWKRSTLFYSGFRPTAFIRQAFCEYPNGMVPPLM